MCGHGLRDKAQLQPFIRAWLSRQGLSWPRSRTRWDSPSLLHRGWPGEHRGGCREPQAGS